GWKAEPSSRAEGKKGGCLRRKARGFPHSRRQSRFFRDFDATLALSGNGWTNQGTIMYIQRRYI
ncbi:MAG: hypothetical protein ABSC21_23900, partial [Terriglobia bacterium]